MRHYKINKNYKCSDCGRDIPLYYQRVELRNNTLICKQCNSKPKEVIKINQFKLTMSALWWIFNMAFVLCLPVISFVLWLYNSSTWQIFILLWIPQLFILTLVVLLVKYLKESKKCGVN